MLLKELFPVMKYQMVTIWFEEGALSKEYWYGNSEELESDTDWGDYEVTSIDTDDYEDYGLSITVKEVAK